MCWHKKINGLTLEEQLEWVDQELAYNYTLETSFTYEIAAGIKGEDGTRKYKNHELLFAMSDRGSMAAHLRLIQGWFRGDYGFTIDPEKIKEKAYAGWKDAQYCYANCLYRGKMFEKDRDKAKELAKKWGLAPVWKSGIHL